MSKPVKHIANGRKMPKTSDELHQFIADSLRELLAIPENAHSIATAVLHAQVRALTDSRELKARAQLEAVLVKSEYNGSIRATVEAPIVEGDLLSVKLEEREGDSDSAWVELKDRDYNEAQLAALTKLVLSQSTVPGEVFYVTTNQAVDQARQVVSDVMFEQAKKIADYDMPPAVGAGEAVIDPNIKAPAGVVDAAPGNKQTLN